jgi:hypothetical protein
MTQNLSSEVEDINIVLSWRALHDPGIGALRFAGFAASCSSGSDGRVFALSGTLLRYTASTGDDDAHQE